MTRLLLALLIGASPAWANPAKGKAPTAPISGPTLPAGAVPTVLPLPTAALAPAALPPGSLAPLDLASPLALEQPAAPSASGRLAISARPERSLALPPPAAPSGKLAESRAPAAFGRAAEPPGSRRNPAEGDREEAGEESSALEGSRLFDGADSESFPELLEKSLSDWEAGRAGAAEPQDLLAAERPEVSAGDAASIRRVEGALVAAVQAAAAETFGRPLKAVSRGSSARLTHDKPNPDFDLMVELPAELDGDGGPLRTDLRGFRAALERAAEREGARLSPGSRVTAYAAAPRALSSASSHKPEPGVLMVPLRVELKDPAGGRSRVIDADVALTTRRKYANAYPELFASQLAKVEAEGGRPAAERLLSDIRLAKKVWREAIGAYKFYQGGPTGVGIEQMVIQAGSFDAMMDRLHGAWFDARGESRGARKASRAWVVPNPFTEPSNFLELLSDGAWKRAAYAARAYRQAKTMGRPIALEDLRWTKPAPPPDPPKPTGPRIVRHADPRGERVIVLRAKPAKPAFQDRFDRFLKRLRRRLALSAPPRQSKGNGAVLVQFPLAPEASPEAQLETVLRYVKASGVAIVEISLPEAPQGAAAPAAPEPAAPKPTTLEFLERFTLSGPKPAERGEAYLLAQGAKALPAELEDSWPKTRRAPNPPARHEEVERGLLQRREGEAIVRVLSVDHDGQERAQFVKVPPEAAAGIASETLVELRHVAGRVAGVTPIGAYPADMTIGRLVRRQGRLLLEGLFRRGGRSVSLYPPLPVAGEGTEGSIVQAYVRPAKSGTGHEAVPLADLGRDITPEIAARDLAFQHGARGWVESAVIRQAEEAAAGYDVSKALAELRAKATPKGLKTLDLRGKPFITIDPVGAGDLDDAYYTERHADGSWTWYLATADVGRFVRPGTPAFRAAARLGNTLYSIDKDGIGEYPMNHPLVSKFASSLLAGKDSLAMITRMRFSADGRLMPEESDVFLGAVRVEGRYTYEQVEALWSKAPDHGIAHLEQVQLTRELARGLHREDDRRGKLDFDLAEMRHRKGPGGWTSEAHRETANLKEAHRLIEELKVYGNRVIGSRLMRITSERGVPHISRVHQAQEERINARVREELRQLGVPWRNEPLAEYLARLRARQDLPPELVEAAQLLVLVSRKAARYAVDDTGEHEGLALEGGAYDHPSTPIRRFSDMFNRALLQAQLDGSDPKEVYETMLADLKAIGFRDLEEYLEHLNGRASAAGRMDLELDEFMSVYELAKPANRGKVFQGHVKLLRRGKDPTAVIALHGSPAFLTVRGDTAKSFELLDAVEVEVRGADLESLSVDARVRRKPRR